MRPVAFVVPGRIDTRTGGSIYDRRMVDGLLARGWPVDVRELGEGFPFPSVPLLYRAAHVLQAIPDGTLTVIDGLALSAMPDLVEYHASRLAIVALVHLPLAADLTLDAATRTRLEADERRALHAAASIVVTGEATVPMLARYGLPRARITIVEPGVEPAPLAQGSGENTLGLLSVGTIGPGKGHELLIQALSNVPHRAWHLTCAGNAVRYPETVERLRAAIRALGLEARVSILGELDGRDLDECYGRADLFVLATRQETYGMAVAEALARGLPIVSTTTGAIPSLVGSEAGLLVEPGDLRALTDALARVMGDAELRLRLGAGARRVRDRLPTWDHAVERMQTVLASVTDRG